MPFKNRRNLAVVSTCISCGQEFHPFRGREDRPCYCSLTCSRAAGGRKVHEMQVAVFPFVSRLGRGCQPNKRHSLASSPPFRSVPFLPLRRVATSHRRESLNEEQARIKSGWLPRHGSSQACGMSRSPHGSGRRNTAGAR